MASFVYIIESPSPSDLADGRTEGRSLREVFDLSNIAHTYTLAVSFSEFVKALLVGDGTKVVRSMNEHRCAPVLHLSMHGNDQGVQLTDGTMLDWAKLKEILTPLNRLLPDGLLVTFSTCGGAGSIRMSMSEDINDKPFLATVGSVENVPWDDAVVAYTAFYHNWFKDVPALACVERMKAASGHDGFSVYSGSEQKQAYITYANQRRLAEALQKPDAH